MAAKNTKNLVPPFPWNQLLKSQQKRLTKLGFDETSWNNNVGETVAEESFAPSSDRMYVYKVMNGDRSRMSWNS